MSVFAWGFNKLGQLGTGDTDDRALPVKMKFANGDRPAQISTGGLFTAVVTLRGDLWVCGCGKYGRLGTGSEEDVCKPCRVSLAKDAKIASICTGSWHACALTYLGRLYSWGYNARQGILGHHTFGHQERENRRARSLSAPARKIANHELQPRVVPALLGFSVQKVACGHNFTLACTKDGGVYSWGSGRHGVLGHGNEESIAEPARIKAFSSIRDVSAGYAHCAAIDDRDHLYTFGKGADGALGLGDDLSDKKVPTLVAALSNVLSVSCSVGEHRGHTLALCNDGVVFAWGSNYMGKLGVGDQTSRHLPVKIEPVYFKNERVKCVSAGGIHSGAVTEDGRVFTWGSGKDGRLGHAEIENAPHSYHTTLPKQVVALPRNKRAVTISCSHYHTVVLLDLP